MRLCPMMPYCWMLLLTIGVSCQVLRPCQAAAPLVSDRKTETASQPQPDRQAKAAEEPPTGEPVDFDRVIRPILSDTCFQCHGPDANARVADLRLDRREGLFRIQDGVAVVQPGDLRASELIQRVTSDDPDVRMPPPESKRQLSASQIASLKSWVAAGAPWGQHWSFQPPRRGQPPAVKDASWPRNPIDRFILARLEQEGLSPSPEASREQLIRRVSLDLTGLPPTPQEVDAFLADDSPGAYEKVVDRLLASPRYGERMVWPWLDAARYADSNGYQADPERTMWPWRDWVIQALNDNKPFDEFTIEQLAGDLLPQPNRQQLVATGFNRNHMFNGEGGRIAEETRVENVFDRTETTATIWLGLTMTCARCHDHKYDPISQKDYYRLYAYFNNNEYTWRYGTGQLPPVIAAPTADQQAELDRLAGQVGRLSVQISAREQRLFPAGGDPVVELSQKVLSIVKRPPQQRGAKALHQLAQATRDAAPQYGELLNELKQTIEQRDRLTKQLPKVMVMKELAQGRKAFVLEKGTYNKPTQERVDPGTPAFLPRPSQDAPKNRLGLARWLVSRDHPLTARVTVNRCWQLFFGRGLVKTTEDFGSQGVRPSHPKLLDWLATELMRTGWDVKALHRLIVTSGTYRQDSRISPELREKDPENRLLGRGPRRRLPSWMIRDQALFASGLLVEQVGGPPVKPYQPAGIWAEATFGKKRYSQDHGDNLYRRSVYIFWRRIVGPTMFFDTANRQTCTVKVATTNTPLHALVTLNDVTFVEAARALAQQVMLAKSLPQERLRLGFRRLLVRQPRPEEMTILTNRLEKLRAQFAHDPQAAKQLLAVGESPRDESVNAVEHAAYTGVCMLLLNLDETLTKQ